MPLGIVLMRRVSCVSRIFVVLFYFMCIFPFVLHFSVFLITFSFQFSSILFFFCLTFKKQIPDYGPFFVTLELVYHLLFYFRHVFFFRLFHLVPVHSILIISYNFLAMCSSFGTCVFTFLSLYCFNFSPSFRLLFLWCGFMLKFFCYKNFPRYGCPYERS